MSLDHRPGSDSGPLRRELDVERTTAHYLYAISTLSKESSGRVTTGAIQEYLDVAPPSVTEMIGKLDDRGLVEYEKYRGVQLTDQGKILASNVSWRLCVVSSFFDSVLDTYLDERTAFDIGFTLPEEGVSRLRERMETTCLDICPEAGHHESGCPA
ncbi:MAG: metal-dependent transcriptional regulator [Halobacteriaceae archaeon]